MRRVVSSTRDAFIPINFFHPEHELDLSLRLRRKGQRKLCDRLRDGLVRGGEFHVWGSNVWGDHFFGCSAFIWRHDRGEWRDERSRWGTEQQGGAVPVGKFDCVPGTIALPMPYLTHRQYDHALRDSFGLDSLEPFGDALPSKLLSSVKTGTLDAERQEAYQVAAVSIADHVFEGSLRKRFVDCEIESDSACLQTTIRDFGRKAFRRPLSAQEVTTLRQNAEAVGTTPDEVAKQALVQFLVSPRFLKRQIVETAREADGSFLLDEHDLATALSFFFYDSIPDDELAAAADSGALETVEQIESQATRMLRDPKATDGIDAFVETYLNMGTFSSWHLRDHDPDVFEGFTPETADLALEAQDRFFSHVILSNETFSELFLSQEAYVNAELAPYYDLDPQQFDDSLVLARLGEQRFGFLTQMAFLTTHAQYELTNPFRRGAFITYRLLGIDVGPPPPSPIFPLPPTEYATNREFAEDLTSPPACATCHDKFLNPPGFVLESFDAVGRLQTVDPFGGAIDPVVEVFFGDHSQVVHDAHELMLGLAESKYTRRVFAESLVEHALSRSPNPEDACLAEQLAEAIARDRPLSELFVQVATSEAFRTSSSN